MTLPEFRLSFQLKIYESVCKGDIDSAKEFLKAHKWLEENVRNILDESDAILQPKYQLIYTVGHQLLLDGGAQRWTVGFNTSHSLKQSKMLNKFRIYLQVVQAVLKRVRHHIKILYKTHGNEKIEFDENHLENAKIYGAGIVQERHDVFSPCRIFDENVYMELKHALINDFIDGKMNIAFMEIVDAMKDSLRTLLSDKDISSHRFNDMMVKFSGTEKNTLMILSGLLRFDVLKLVLMKRWRVNYGVNPKSSRKTAVPFKAKDVAAEMTEFGHPDVAICLTQLSYYYSGLFWMELCFLRSNM